LRSRPAKYYLFCFSNLLSDTLACKNKLQLPANCAWNALYMFCWQPSMYKSVLIWGPCGLSVPFGIGLSAHFVNLKFQGIQIIRCFAGVFL